MNAFNAVRIARRLGLELAAFAVKDAGETVAADLLVLDLDHLPADCRANLLAQAATSPKHSRSDLAVHSYNLNRAELRVLRRAGVRVARRLTAGLLAPVTA